MFDVIKIASIVLFISNLSPRRISKLSQKRIFFYYPRKLTFFLEMGARVNVRQPAEEITVFLYIRENIQAINFLTNFIKYFNSFRIFLLLKY